MIIHCMKKAHGMKKTSERMEIAIWRIAGLYCCTVNYLWRVMPNFLSIDEPLVLVCLDESKMLSEVK